MDEVKALGKAIKIRRIELDISQDSLSTSSDIARSHLSKIESGSANVGSKKLVLIAKVLKLSVWQLWKRAEELVTEPTK